MLTLSSVIACKSRFHRALMKAGGETSFFEILLARRGRLARGEAA